MPVNRTGVLVRPIGRSTLLMNGSVAPVCPTVRSQPVPGQRPTRTAAIPLPTDLPSVIRAVNQLINIYNYSPLNVPRWVEINRVVSNVRIFNPNDQQQWVDVERISSLTFQDQFTDGLFEWVY